MKRTLLFPASVADIASDMGEGRFRRDELLKKKIVEYFEAL